jgi:hypothetical protein
MAAVLLLGGCSGEPRDAGPADAATAATTPPVSGHGSEPLPAPLPQPTDDAPSQEAALVRGAEAVTAFARPQLDPGLWWAELSPLLSPAAAEAYAGTDPVEVPAREVTGPPRTGTSPSAFLATVFVPTDAGEYAVLLVREGGGAPWLVERITQVPPDAVDPPASGIPAPTGTAEAAP